MVNPTGLALARPNAQPLYALLDMAPKLDFEQQFWLTKHYFRALNGLGMTSALIVRAVSSTIRTITVSLPNSINGV